MALAALSGWVDATGLFLLGGAFTSVMTGNIVLLGLNAGRLHASAALPCLVAVAGFTAGCALGAVTESRRGGAARVGVAWPPVVTRLLLVENVLLAAAALAWTTFHAHGRVALHCVLLIDAVALGLQSSAVTSFRIPGLSTTYFTGTLTSLVVDAARGRGLRHHRRAVGQLTALLSGAAAAAIAGHLCPVTALLVPPIGMGAVLALRPRSTNR